MVNAFSEDKSNVAKMIISVFDRIKNIVGNVSNEAKMMPSVLDMIQNIAEKGEMLATNSFSFLYTVLFQKASLSWS